MNLSYSDEQNMLREQVLKFCESDYTFDVREKIVESNYGHNPETWNPRAPKNKNNQNQNAFYQKTSARAA